MAPGELRSRSLTSGVCLRSISSCVKVVALSAELTRRAAVRVAVTTTVSSIGATRQYDRAAARRRARGTLTVRKPVIDASTRQAPDVAQREPARIVGEDIRWPFGRPAVEHADVRAGQGSAVLVDRRYRLRSAADRSGWCERELREKTSEAGDGRQSPPSWRQGRIDAPSGVSRAEKGRARVARFPDLRIDGGIPSLPRRLAPSDLARSRLRAWRDFTRPLAAYSGGTVWDLHPLRVAAGASVKLCPDYSADRAGSVASWVNYFVTYPVRTGTSQKPTRRA